VAYGAIDLHKKESQIRIVTDEGDTIDRRISTRRESFTMLFGGQPPMRVLLEASTESEWVACHLEGLGHHVIVADPNYAAMYGGRSRRIKTDLRDVAALTIACAHGTYRAIHRRSPARRRLQAALNVRETVVQTRGGLISMIRAMTRAEGLRIPSGDADSFVVRLAKVSMTPSLTDTIEPLRAVIQCLTEQLRRIDAHIAADATGDPTIARLMTFPAIGPVTASAFVAAVDDVTRFQHAGQVANYFGLVPSEYSSGEQQRRGHVVRSAHPRVQSLLVQAAWRLRLSKRSETAALRRWAEQVARRRGARIAVVALARRIARILYALWRDSCPYDALHRPQRNDIPAAADGWTAST
jgi:transposase